VTFQNGIDGQGHRGRTSPTNDLAVIKVDGVDDLVPPVREVGSLQTARPSSPPAPRSGSSESVTSGIVSNTARPSARATTTTPSTSRADRRGHQPRELRRPAGRPQRLGRRHQLLDRQHRLGSGSASRATSGSASPSRPTSRPASPLS
jgi:hypothetical protein